MRSLPVLVCYTILCLLLSVTACINEDLSDCPPLISTIDTRIVLSYIPFSEETWEGFEAEELESITVFAFDSLGYFVAKVTDAIPRLDDPAYSLSLHLPPGHYDFYAWGNVRDCYFYNCTGFVEKETKASLIGLEYLCPDNDSTRTAPHPLFFASAENINLKSTKSAEGITQTVTLPLVKDTYNIWISLIGLGQNHRLEAIVTDNNISYGFDNSFHTCDYMHYIAPFLPDSQTDCLQTKLTTLRLERNRSPRLKLYNSIDGELIYHNDLIDLILAAEKVSGKKIDFSRQYNFKIALHFAEGKSGKTTITVSVNGWQVVKKEVTIDFGKPNLPK